MMFTEHLQCTRLRVGAHVEKMESCQGTCSRPHPVQQVSKTGRPTMKPSPKPGAVPTPMLSPGKQAGGPESNSYVNFKN